MKRKKPTSKEVQTVIDNLILQMMNLEQKILSLSKGFIEYIEFKKDTKKFEKYLQGKEAEFVRQKSSRKNTNRK